MTPKILFLFHRCIALYVGVLENLSSVMVMNVKSKMIEFFLVLSIVTRIQLSVI